MADRVFDAAVIGSGAAGMLAAGRCCEAGLSVALIESNNRQGAKIRITGKGRCNLTNNCSPRQYMDNAVSNKKFLFSAADRFSPADTIQLFERLGVPLKTERGGRVFPVSDNANDVAEALVRYCSGAVLIRSAVKSVDPCEPGWAVDCGERKINAKNVIIATGGMSYPRTGSTGDGYEFAEKLGHTVIAPRPSLIPLLCAESGLCRDLQGLSLKNVELSLMLEGAKKPLFSERGEMLFTHFGISGPMVLSASAHLGDPEVKKRASLESLFENGELSVCIDLKPALSHEELDARVLRDFGEEQNRDFRNSLSKLLPSKLIMPIVKLSGIDGAQKVNSVTAEQRSQLVRLLKALRLTVIGTRPIDEAVVTAGGVCVNEITPSTMQSKLHSGLYFAGEVLDIDCYTGGYNLQTAFCTAACAADSIIAKERQL